MWIVNVSPADTCWLYSSDSRRLIYGRLSFITILVWNVVVTRHHFVTLSPFSCNCLKTFAESNLITNSNYFMEIISYYNIVTEIKYELLTVVQYWLQKLYVRSVDEGSPNGDPISAQQFKCRALIGYQIGEPSYSNRTRQFCNQLDYNYLISLF